MIRLTTNNIEITFTESFKLLFLSNTKSPNPALESNPLIAAPKVIVPFISIIVIAIEIAQFGIKPITAAIKHCRKAFALFARKSVIGKCSSK